MSDKIVELRSKTKNQIYNQFPPLRFDEVPDLYKIKAVEYDKNRIEEYDVYFWHQLLKSIYQEPLDIECELHFQNQENTNPELIVLRNIEKTSKWKILDSTEDIAMKIQSGEAHLIPMNWRYFFRLPDGGIIEVGAKKRHTIIYFAIVIQGEKQEEVGEHVAKFINLLLAEANRANKNNTFSPIEEFKKAEGLKLYQLVNVYLQNYISAKHMLLAAIGEEKRLRDELFKYDPKTDDWHDLAKSAHMDEYYLACGVFFSSAITHFILSLEGFINLIFHAFLKNNVKVSGLNVEKRFDIEQKFKLLPLLCEGFVQEQFSASSELYSKFTKLKDYRNSIFHSKIEEALKSLVMLKDGIVYSRNVDKYIDTFLPAQRLDLTADHVVTVKNIVDEIIMMILNSMTKEMRLMTEKYILKATHIPFFIRSDGTQHLGEQAGDKQCKNPAQQKNQPDAE